MKESIPYPVPKVRMYLAREAAGSYRRRPTIESSLDAVAVVKKPLRSYAKEVFAVLSLDSRCRLLQIHHASEGNSSSCIVQPREVFGPAIIANASSIICVHNHPSGDPKPSNEDEMLRERLSVAGEILGIPMIDFLVIGDDDYRSIGALHGEHRTA